MRLAQFSSVLHVLALGGSSARYFSEVLQPQQELVAIIIITQNSILRKRFCKVFLQKIRRLYSAYYSIYSVVDICLDDIIMPPRLHLTR